jgi:predicted nucleic acid-binding protein
MAMADAADRDHQACREIRDAWLERGIRLVTIDYIADETLTLIRKRLGVASAMAWWQLVEQSRRLHWEQVDGIRAEKARRWSFPGRTRMFRSPTARAS